MVRRTFWMVVGAVLGAWMVVKVQRAASHLTPSGALAAAQRRARHLGHDVTAALADGRRTKRATEAGLREMARSRPAIDASGSNGRPAVDDSWATGGRGGHGADVGRATGARAGLAPAGPTEDLPVRR